MIEAVYREVAPKLQAYLIGSGCSYATACDVVQETFLRLWRRREELSDDLEQVSGLVFTIARNYRNDLYRKSRREVLGNEIAQQTEEEHSDEVHEMSRPGEEAEEAAQVCCRLRTTLLRMPSQLLEIFMLSRLGSLSVKDIAEGVGLSESNVKVRIHRAKRLFLACYKSRETGEVGAHTSRVFAWALLRAMMLLAAIDGAISKEELGLYRQLAERFRGKDTEDDFEAEWEKSIREMAYLGFLSELLPREELVRVGVREMREAFALVGEYDVHQVYAALVRMANVDGDYSAIERELIQGFARPKSCDLAREKKGKLERGDDGGRFG